MALQVKFRWWSFSGATACREFELFATTNVCICFAHRQWFPDTSHRCTTLYVHNAKSIALIYPNRLFVIIRQLMRMLSYSGRVASRNRSRFFFSLTIRFLRKCSRAFVIMLTANNSDGWCTQRSGKPFSCFRTKTCRHLFYRFWVRKVVSMANRKKRAATVDVETWERIFFFLGCTQALLVFLSIRLLVGALSAVFFDILLLTMVLLWYLVLLNMFRQWEAYVYVCAATNSLSVISTSWSPPSVVTQCEGKATTKNQKHVFKWPHY